MKKWEVVALPPLLVEILEAKHVGESVLTSSQAVQWWPLSNSLEATIEDMRRFSSHDALDREVEIAAQSLMVLQEAIVASPWTEEFQEACYRLYRAMANYGEIRKELTACPVLQFDTLIHALQAHLRGRLSLAVARQFQPPAIARMEELVSLYKRAEDSLPVEIRQGLLSGIDLCSQALASLAGEDPGTLTEACALLRDGGTLLAHLQNWKAAAESEGASAIPLVGEQVTQMLADLESSGQLDDEVLELWTEDWFWQLQESWAQARHDFFMPRAKKDQLVGRLDALMVELRDLVEKPPRLQLELLLSAERHFEEIAISGFNLEFLAQHRSAWMADVFLAVLAGGVPSYQALEFRDSLLSSSEHQYGQLLASYLEGKDRDFLLDALELMQNECEAQQFQDLQS